MKKPVLELGDLREIMIALKIAKIDAEDDFFDNAIELVQQHIVLSISEALEKRKGIPNAIIDFHMFDDQLRDTSIALVESYRRKHDHYKELINDLKSI